LKSLTFLIVLLMPYSVFAIDLSFSDFVGSYRLIKCTQYENSAMVAPTGLCDVSTYRLFALTGQIDQYQLRFTDISGNDVKLPDLVSFKNETDTFIEVARFGNTPIGANWIREKKTKPKFKVISSESFSVFLDGDSVPTLTHTVYFGTTIPPLEIRQNFKLEKIQP
jgi:hypothetical protein